MLTPYDVYKKEFRRVFRGYDEQEVDEFLDQVAATMKELYREIEELRAQSAQDSGKLLAAIPARSGPAKKVMPEDGQELLQEMETKLEALRREVNELVDSVFVRAAQRAEDALLEAETRLGELVARVQEEAEQTLQRAAERVDALLSEAAQKFRFLLSREINREERTKRAKRAALITPSRTRKV